MNKWTKTVTGDYTTNGARLSMRIMRFPQKTWSLYLDSGKVYELKTANRGAAKVKADRILAAKAE